MMKYAPFFVLVLIVLILSGVLRSEATAGAQVATSMVNGNLIVRPSSLLVKIKHKNKHNDDNDDQSSSGNDAALSECIIQQPGGGGGGCTVGFKRVCEKMKNGNKCCGCVVDKNASPARKANICEHFPLGTVGAAVTFSSKNPGCKSGTVCNTTNTAILCCCTE